MIHLSVHSEYSLVDGLIRIEALMERCVQFKMPAVALTDHMNIFGAVKFYQAAIAAGIKPILGAELVFYRDQYPDQPHHLIVLCQNQQGYHHLSQLLTRAYLEGQYQGRAYLRASWLSGLTEGLIAISAGILGNIGQSIVANHLEEADQHARAWMALFPDRFYLEVQRNGHEHEEIYLQACLDLAEKYALPVIASNRVCFLDAEDFEAHETRVCIHEGHVLEDTRRVHRHTEQQYFRSSEEMQALFSDLPELLKNTRELAKRCSFTMALGKNYLPPFPVPHGNTMETYLASAARQGLVERLPQRSPIYDDRLTLELEVINQMGFAGYFLIVADFIQWAKSQDIPVGPGRGSGAGSLVAYALKITDLDPLTYDLLFERFLNPERVSMPDFDIDFCMEKRDAVIDYVSQKYGRSAVSQIITFGTMAAKAAVRDVGRVLNFPYGFVDTLAKLIPFELGITLDLALKEPALKARYEAEEDVRSIIDLARKLEGITRNAGKHAGGVVIAPGKLTDFTALYCEEGSTTPVTQFDKDDVEAVGLVKFDFLGLRTLTIIHWAVKAINQKHSPPLEMIHLALDDTATFDLLKTCATTAVFQLESRGMKDLIKRLQPDCFEEIIALVALFRPGPLQSGMVDDFIERKHGRAKIDYPHPDLKSILQPTYGIILYQEQVMQIAQKLAGYSLGAADILRRAMGKKKPEEMAKQREIFITGAKQNGVDETVAAHIFDLMEKFAGYGFNKSHSAAYALLSYQTAWLKAHYPAEFMAAVLSSDMDNTDKLVVFYEEALRMGLTVLVPDIQQSDYEFRVDAQGRIAYGLGAIKGVGEAALQDILEDRQKTGPFKSLYDFCQRSDSRKVTKRVLEALIKSGALDTLGESRAVLMASLPIVTQAVEQAQAHQVHHHGDLFSEGEEAGLDPGYQAAVPWLNKERLAYEKETLGFYFSGHPYAEYQAEVEQITQVKMSGMGKYLNSEVTVAGLVVGLKPIKTKKGARMASITLDDQTGRIDVLAFPEIYEASRELLKMDEILLIQGGVSLDEFSGNYRLAAKRILSLTEMRETHLKSLRILLKAEQASKEKMQSLAECLKAFPGKCRVELAYDRDQAFARLPLGAAFSVKPEDALLEALRALFSSEAVSLIYRDLPL